jgi:hypothetical protein
LRRARLQERLQEHGNGRQQRHAAASGYEKKRIRGHNDRLRQTKAAFGPAYRPILMA